MSKTTSFLLAALCLFSPPVTRASTPPVVLVVDTSGSMSGDKLYALQEGAKLAVSLLDGQLVVIAFSSQASASPMFAIGDRDGRRAAITYVDSLTAGGDTNYLAPLAKLRAFPTGSPCIFISDGENGEGSDAQVLELLSRAPGPVHTIAVDASGKAQKLLSEMAAQSGGSVVSVDDAEGLTKAILGIAQRLGHYHVHTPAEETLAFANCRDSVIAIGFDAVPSMTGTPSFPEPPFQHRAKLRTEHVVLSRVSLSAVTDLEIRSLDKRKPTGRLARVLRSDLVQPVLGVAASSGKVPAGGEVTVMTNLFDRDGNRIDPRSRPDIQVEYGLQDANQNTIARRPAIPSTSQPSLTATLPVPNVPGPVTIVQTAKDTSTGAPFYSEDAQTVIAVEPMRLAVEPGELKLSPRRGAFTIAITAKTADGKPVPGSLSASLAGAPAHLSIVRSDSSGDRLTIEFRADRHGIFRGELEIHGNSAVPVAPLKVPYEFDVLPKYLGLALPESHQVMLGTVLATAGESVVATWSVPSHDSEDVPPIQVRVTDLAHGSSVIPLRADQVTVAPAKDMPAQLKLVANVGNVPAGLYEGSVLFQVDDPLDDRRWQAVVRIAVTEPLSVAPLDFGKIEIGKSASKKLLIRNSGAPLRNVALTAGPFAQGDSQLAAADVAVSAPDEIPLVAGMSETAVDINVTLSPILNAAGRYEATLFLSRTPAAPIQVPVRLEIVGQGEGECDFLVAPESLRLKATAGDIVSFSLRIKPAKAAVRLTELSLRSAAFEDATNQIIPVESDFVVKNPEALRAHDAIEAEGFFIAPGSPGTYHGTVVISTERAGTRRIPVTLEITQ